MATLSTRTTVFGVMNPKAPPTLGTSAAASLSAPLLSRFDILLQLVDVRSEARDGAVADSILRSRQVCSLALLILSKSIVVVMTGTVCFLCLFVFQQGFWFFTC